MDGTPMLEIAYHHDVQAVNPSALLADRVQVKQCLAGMFPGSVSGVDDGHTCGPRVAEGFLRRAGSWMTLHNHVAVTCDRADRGDDTFVLYRRGMMMCIERTDA